MRILALDPALTELAFALGAGAHIVGRASDCVYPESARSIPCIGDVVDRQSIGVFEPDLILAGEHFIPTEYRAFRLASETVDGFLDEVRSLGHLLDADLEAGVVIHEIEQAVECVYQRCKRFRVSPVMVIGGSPIVHDLVRIAGGQVMLREERDLPAAGFVIVIGDDNAGQIAQAKWSSLPAVQNERLFVIPPDKVARTPRISDGLWTLARILHGVTAR